MPSSALLDFFYVPCIFARHWWIPSRCYRNLVHFFVCAIEHFHVQLNDASRNFDVRYVWALLLVHLFQSSCSWDTNNDKARRDTGNGTEIAWNRQRRQGKYFLIRFWQPFIILIVFRWFRHHIHIFWKIEKTPFFPLTIGSLLGIFSWVCSSLVSVDCNFIVSVYVYAFCLYTYPFYIPHTESPM